MRLLLWGISPILQNKIEQRDYILDKNNVVGYVDSNINYERGMYNGKPVFAPKELENNLDKFDYILITSDMQKDELLKQAIDIPGLQGRIMPFEFIYPTWDDQYSVAYSSQYVNNIEIVKRWYVVTDNRNMLFSVRNELGNSLIIHVVYGGVGTDRRRVGCRIEDVQNDKELFRGEVFDDDEISIDINNNLSIYRIEIFGLGRCFVSIILNENKVFESIDDEQLKDTFAYELSRLNDVRWHDFDYSFLEELKECSDFTIVDVGANIGQSSISFLMQTQMAVLALEPHPSYKQILDMVKERYKDRFSYMSCGVGEEDGNLSFYLPRFKENITQEASFNKYAVISVCEKALNVKIDESNEDEYIKTVIIPVITLDSVEDNINKPVVFVKIDAETYELEVIQGMRRMIRKYRPIMLLEYSNVEMMHRIMNVVNEEAEYVKAHWDYNYGCFTEENVCQSINYFLLPKDNPYIMIDDAGKIKMKN